MTRTNRSPFFKALIALLSILLILAAVFLTGRFGWKLLKFSVCDPVAIESVTVTEKQAEITGFDPSSFPSGFIGCYTEEQNGKLYVGFNLSTVFGWFEPADFTVQIPLKGEITEIYSKTADSESLIWSADGAETADDAAPPVMQTPTAEQAYATVIGEYYTMLSENWDAETMMAAGYDLIIKDCTPDDPLKQFGYLITDLDGDGSKELLIGTISDDPFCSKLIYALYTLKEGEAPKQLWSSTERSRYYYAGENNFAYIGSSSAFDTEETTFAYKDGKMTDLARVTEQKDYVQAKLTPFAEWVK